MTSIRQDIWDLERDGALVPLPIARGRRAPIRRLLAPPGVLAAIQERRASERQKPSPMPFCDALDAFVRGGAIRLRVPPSRNPNADLALLEDPLEEVWAFRCRDSDPQVRLFGSFADCDLFVALVIKDKSECHTREHYEAAKEESKRQWRSLFPACSPFHGDRPHDYVSNASVVDG